MRGEITNCKDCGTVNVIKTKYKRGTIDICANCLKHRAQLQTMKEDKLSFPRLLQKIRGEMSRDLRLTLKQEKLGTYTGVNPYASAKNLSNYWVEQLS